MGYTTEFNGAFQLDKTLTVDHLNYLKAFGDTRRMKRDPKIAETMADPIRLAVGLPIGVEGEYFVGGEGFAGQIRDNSVVDGNCSPENQPGLWCQWTPTPDGNEIEWDGGEKFHDYVEWLQYIINNFLTPWGYTLDGEVTWQGEDSDDMGKIVVKGNKIKTLRGEVVYRDEDGEWN